MSAKISDLHTFLMLASYVTDRQKARADTYRQTGFFVGGGPVFIWEWSFVPRDWSPNDHGSYAFVDDPLIVDEMRDRYEYLECRSFAHGADEDGVWRMGPISYHEEQRPQLVFRWWNTPIHDGTAALLIIGAE